LKGDPDLNTKVLVPALALAVLVLVVASALLVFRGGLEGVLPGQPGVVRLRPGERVVVGGAEVMVDFGVARYFVCRDRESGWERVLEARAGWVLAVVIVYYNQPPGYPERVAWVERYTANLTTARGETVRHCDENTCGDKIWYVFWPRGEAVECRYYKNPYQYYRGLTFPIKPGDEPVTARFYLYVDKTRYTVEVKIKD
jgi:hypothetical protein